MNKTAKGPLSRLLATPHILWSVLFILIPLAFVAFYAFTDNNLQFTTEHISEFFTPKYLNVFLRSVKLAFIATLICLVIGYPAAYFISRTSPNAQKILVVLIMLPMWCNLLIRTYALMALLDNGGLLNSFLDGIGLEKLPIVGSDFGVILGMVYDFLPYMVLPIFTAMTKLDYRYIEASHDLGCNAFQTMTKVVMPLTLSGVVSGVTMVFVPSISTFYISQKLGGNKTMLIGDVIERQFQQSYNYNLGAAISLVLMVLILVSMAVMNRFTGDEEGMVI